MRKNFILVLYLIDLSPPATDERISLGINQMPTYLFFILLGSTGDQEQFVVSVFYINSTIDYTSANKHPDKVLGGTFTPII